YRTDGFSRTDFAASYNYGVGVGARKVDLFIQAQVVNILNQQDLCGCGGTVFVNGGSLQLVRVSGASQNQSILTPVTSATMAAFNPLTTTPVEGVNFAKTATFGTPNSRFSFTSPRTFRVTFGVRF